MAKNTIIIGSGISGLFVLKHLKESGNHDVLVLDKNPKPFGVWNIDNHPSVSSYTYTVSSKLYMTISDFPIPNEFPEFPHHSDILKYYLSYAEKFDLIKYIKQNITVLNIEKKNNIWYIKTKKDQYTCRNLVIACGTVNNAPNIPNDPIFNKFTGCKIHSDEFEKYKADMVNKNILIVGVSDTSCDLAEHLKSINNVTLSSNRGVWFQNRNAGAYAPSDMFYNRFIDYIIKNIVGKNTIDYIFGRNWITGVALWWGENGHGIKEWKTESGYLNSYYVKSRDIISSISKGEIKPVDGIENIENNGSLITFKNGYKQKFDIIIFSTGYKPFGGLKFIDKKYYQNLYKHIFSIEDPTISFAGYIRPYLTSIPMLSELQSRWIAQEINNNYSSLPNRDEMLKEVNSDKCKQMEEFPNNYKRLGTLVDPYDYCNSIAVKINAKPSWWQVKTIIFFILLGSWNHHYFRLNDKSEEKRKFAYENIISLTPENPTSLYIQGISKIIIFFVIALLLMVLLWVKKSIACRL